MKDKLVCGWGINDVNSPTTKTKTINGKIEILWSCPYYRDWKSMLHRCYDPNYHNKRPTYIGCSVCEEWKYFSNFKKWVDSQPNRNWMNCNLDKDFILEENKQYSPDTAVYLPSSVNNFIINSKRTRGNCMVGVSNCSYKRAKRIYNAYCNNPFTGKQESLGHFETELEAHKTWQAKKHEHALRLADEQDDPRVAKVLRERYAPDKDWTNR